MPICPFSHDYRECYPECAIYVPAVNKCSFFVQGLLLEDLQKLALVSYNRYIREEEEFLADAMEEAELEAEEEAEKEKEEETPEEAKEE